MEGREQDSKPAATPPSPHLRQGDEPTSRTQSRRLSLDVLLTAVRRSSDEANLQAANALSFVCEEELSGICGAEQKLVHLANRTMNGNSNTPIVLEAVRGVHICLATNSESLRPDCIVNLVRSFLQGYTPSRGGMSTTSTPQPLPSWWEKYPNIPDQTGTREPHDTSAGRAPAQIYLLNSGTIVLSAPGFPAIGNWSHHNYWRPPQGTSDMHPIVWILVLPFFCVGVVVSVKAGIALYKRRRNPSPVAVTNSEYIPLNVHDSSS